MINEKFSLVPLTMIIAGLCVVSSCKNRSGRGVSAVKGDSNSEIKIALTKGDVKLDFDYSTVEPRLIDGYKSSEDRFYSCDVWVTLKNVNLEVGKDIEIGTNTVGSRIFKDNVQIPVSNKGPVDCLKPGQVGTYVWTISKENLANLTTHQPKATVDIAFTTEGGDPDGKRILYERSVKAEELLRNKLLGEGFDYHAEESQSAYHPAYKINATFHYSVTHQ
jgi:hypothetical protein